MSVGAARRHAAPTCNTLKYAEELLGRRQVLARPSGKGKFEALLRFGK
jgi:hypothetical protein